MGSITVDLPVEKPSDILGVQLLFNWTRSSIIDDAEQYRFWPGGIQLPTDQLRVFVDGSYAYLRFKSDSVVGSFKSVEVPYTGEALHPVWQHWIRDERDLRKSKDDVRRWIECRWACCTHSAHYFFLLLELETNSLLFVDWPDDPKRDREKLMTAIKDLVLYRLCCRAAEKKPESKVLIDNSVAVAETCDLLQKLIAQTYRNDTDTAKVGFGHFAAGWLRQNCLIDGLLYVASDADSAYVFLFAELIFALVELTNQGGEYAKPPWTSRLEYWTEFLPVFVWMQQIFLARFERDDPHCFEDYRKVAQLDKAKLPQWECIKNPKNCSMADLQKQMNRNLEWTFTEDRRRKCLPFCSTWDDLQNCDPDAGAPADGDDPCGRATSERLC